MKQNYQKHKYNTTRDSTTIKHFQHSLIENKDKPFLRKQQIKIKLNNQQDVYNKNKNKNKTIYTLENTKKIQNKQNSEKKYNFLFEQTNPKLNITNFQYSNNKLSKIKHKSNHTQNTVQQSSQKTKNSQFNKSRQRFSHNSDIYKNKIQFKAPTQRLTEISFNYKKNTNRNSLIIKEFQDKPLFQQIRKSLQRGMKFKKLLRKKYKVSLQSSIHQQSLKNSQVLLISKIKQIKEQELKSLLVNTNNQSKINQNRQLPNLSQYLLNRFIQLSTTTVSCAQNYCN